MAERDVWAIHDTQGYGSTVPSGCGFYRIVLPFDELREHGWKAGYGVSLPPYDPAIIVAQRFDVPEVLPLWRTLKGHFPLVYEIDDNPFALDPVNWQARTLSADRVLETIREGAAMSDLVTVSTAPLVEVFSEFNDNVVAIPNFIPADVLAIVRPRHQRLTIGYTGGTSHFRDLAMIARTWQDVIDTTGVRGHFQGVDFRNMVRRGSFDHTDWEPDPRNYYRRIDFDIALAPIAENAFSRCKTNLKCLEYAALGIPVVASDCEAYRDFVIDGVTGFLVEGQQQWRQAMLTLIGDEQLRAEMSIKARELAASWTIEGNWQRWADAYEGLL